VCGSDAAEGEDEVCAGAGCAANDCITPLVVAAVAAGEVDAGWAGTAAREAALMVLTSRVALVGRAVAAVAAANMSQQPINVAAFEAGMAEREAALMVLTILPRLLPPPLPSSSPLPPPPAQVLRR